MTNQPDSNGGQTGIPARSGAPGAPGAQGVQGAEGSGLSSNSPHAEEPQLDPQTRKQATRAMLKYGAARLGLFLGLTIVIQALAVLIGAQVPLVVSALLALLVALPLSMLIFKNSASKPQKPSPSCAAAQGPQRVGQPGTRWPLASTSSSLTTENPGHHGHDWQGSKRRQEDGIAGNSEAFLVGRGVVVHVLRRRQAGQDHRDIEVVAA